MYEVLSRKSGRSETDKKYYHDVESEPVLLLLLFLFEGEIALRGIIGTRSELE